MRNRAIASYFESVIQAKIPPLKGVPQRGGGCLSSGLSNGHPPVASLLSPFEGGLKVDANLDAIAL